MAKVGGRSPLPHAVGGGQCRAEKVWAALRKAVGRGGAGPVGGIEDSWRFARARGFAAVASFSERAIKNFFPDRATDHIEVFEGILGLTPPIGASDEARRQEIVPRWTLQIDASESGLAQQLAEIDPRLSILHMNPGRQAVTHVGRVFEPHVLTATDGAFNLPAKNSSYPNVSDDFICIVLFDVGAGVAPTPSERRVVEQVVDLLNSVLPAWVGWHIIYEDQFVLDISLLDAGAPT